MPENTGLPYTPAVRAGDWIVVSGQIGLADGALVAGGFEAELRQTLVNLRERLAEVGASISQVVKTTVFLADLADYPAMNVMYGEAFPPPRPARSAFAVTALPLGAAVEIEAWAYLGR